MLSKFIANKDKIELWSLDRGMDKQSDNGQKIYHSAVHSILSEDTMEIEMPTEQSKLLLLPIDSEYEMFIYGATGVYQCFVRIIERYKSNNVYISVVELKSDLRKNQRREFYRFSCALEMHARNAEEEEASTERSIIIDISGGGFRFVSERQYELNSLVYCTYHLSENGRRRKYEIMGEVLAVKEWENRPGMYEHRVQYHNLDVDTREQIIKYIFEEERKERKKIRLT